jgi:hypothetical protein
LFLLLVARSYGSCGLTLFDSFSATLAVHIKRSHGYVGKQDIVHHQPDEWIHHKAIFCCFRVTLNGFFVVAGCAQIWVWEGWNRAEHKGVRGLVGGRKEQRRTLELTLSFEGGR